MDERYYMLGALGLLLVGLIVYFLIALVRYRAAVRRARVLRQAEQEGEGRYLGTLAEHTEDVFSVAVAQTVPEPGAPAPEAPHPQVYDFTIPSVHRAEAPSPVPEVAAPAAEPVGEPAPIHAARPPAPQPEMAGDEFDFASEQPDEPHIPTPVAAPPVEASDWFGAGSQIESVTAPQPEPEPEPEMPPAPQPEPEMPPEPHREPEPEPEPEPQPEPEPEMPPAPQPVPGPDLPSLPEPEPPAEPTPPGPSTLPGYSLADELERLMAAATASSGPLLTPAEHAAVVSPPVSPETLEPSFEVAPESLFPMPSVGQALSSAAAGASGLSPVPDTAPVQRAFTPDWESTLVMAPEQSAAPAAPPMAAEPRPARARDASEVPDYKLVAPVELHFTVGQNRIGVKPGTRSYAEFQRLAGILLDDLRTARGW